MKHAPEEKSFNSKPPRADYLTVSLVPTLTIIPKASIKQLLILDLNGPLCQQISSGGFFLRPHAQSFFEFIFHNFSVMVWSSAPKESVDIMCKMFGSHQPAYIWDRRHFANLTPSQFKTGSEVAKDLNQVWKLYPQYDASNTIVLDDNVAKLPSQPHNLVRISSFESLTSNQDKLMDRDLVKVANYLRLVRVQCNVSNFILFMPFNVESYWDTQEDSVADKRVERYDNDGQLLRNEKYDYPAHCTIPLKINNPAEIFTPMTIKVESSAEAEQSTCKAVPKEKIEEIRRRVEAEKQARAMEDAIAFLTKIFTELLLLNPYAKTPSTSTQQVPKPHHSKQAEPTTTLEQREYVHPLPPSRSISSLSASSGRAPLRSTVNNHENIRQSNSVASRLSSVGRDKGKQPVRNATALSHDHTVAGRIDKHGHSSSSSSHHVTTNMKSRDISSRIGKRVPSDEGFSTSIAHAKRRKRENEVRAGKPQNYFTKQRENESMEKPYRLQGDDDCYSARKYQNHFMNGHMANCSRIQEDVDSNSAGKPFTKQGENGNIVKQGDDYSNSARKPQDHYTTKRENRYIEKPYRLQEDDDSYGAKNSQNHLIGQRENERIPNPKQKQRGDYGNSTRKPKMNERGDKNH